MPMTRTLRGKTIELVPIADQHLATLHAWRNSNDYITLCSTRRNTVTFQEFKDELRGDFKRDRHLQYVICRKETHIGTIFSYNLNRTDSYAFITLYVDAAARNMGLGVESIVLFSKYLFHNLRLHKLYFDVYSYNTSCISCLVSAGIKQEGCFRGHRLLDGTRFDLLRFALFHGQLPQNAKIVTYLAKVKEVEAYA
jgi:RimJ/RimL family protein N-acetyltransferase